MTTAPLRRNRDFLLLQTAQLLASGGSQMTAIAYPLLVLALTGSPAKAGLVAFARLLAMAVFALPAGLLADHWSRRRLMIGTYALRALAIGTLAALVLTDQILFWVIPVVAFVEGSGAALSSAAGAGARRSVVPRTQLPAARRRSAWRRRRSAERSSRSPARCHSSRTRRPISSRRSRCSRSGRRSRRCASPTRRRFARA